MEIGDYFSAGTLVGGTPSAWVPVGDVLALFVVGPVTVQFSDDGTNLIAGALSGSVNLAAAYVRFSSDTSARYSARVARVVSKTG